MKYHNGQAFFTFDQDNDRSSMNCSAHKYAQGAWWYSDCLRLSLNGKYAPVGHKYGGIKWYPRKRFSFTLMSSSMMIRKV